MNSSMNTTFSNQQVSYSILPPNESAAQQQQQQQQQQIPTPMVENISNVAPVPMISTSAAYPVTVSSNNPSTSYSTDNNHHASSEFLPNAPLSGNKRPLLPETTSMGSTNMNNNNNNNNNSSNIHKNCPIKPQTEQTLAPLNREGRNLSEKKLRRLEKNRISARECRRKKKEAAQNLEREIHILEGENLELRLKLQIGDEAEKTSQNEQKRLIEELNSMMNSGASESEIYATIEEFKERCADYGRDRRSAIEFHLSHVERLLMPTTTTTVAMRALQGNMGANVPDNSETPVKIETDTVSQSNVPIKKEEEEEVDSGNKEDDTISKNKDFQPKSLFHFLVNYLEVTPEQAAILKDSRSVAKDLDSSLAESVAMLHELRRRLSECGEDLEAEFANVRSILCPSQAAKFLVWVENNSACMHMLNELWNKVYPKPILPSREDQNG